MLYLVILVGLVGPCLGGGFYPHPSLSTAEAHGPLARLVLDTMRERYYGSPVAIAPVAAVPVAAPPVDVVHHVPAVADVPVTKYSAQPGFVQKVVDIPTAKVATAKLQVRRPAIQKQFYDIEERTVIRPVGSAVVELDEPVSKNLISPFTVSPAGYHTLAQYQRPLAYPVSSYPFVSYSPLQAPVHYYPSQFIQQTPGVAQYPPPVQQTVFPPPQAPPQPQRPVVPTAQPPQQQQPSFPQPSPPSLEDSFPNDFDSSDSIVVDNPDLERSSTPDQSQSVSNAQKKPEDFDQEKNTDNKNEQNPIQDQPASAQEILNEFQTRQLTRQFLRQQDLQPVQRFQQSQFLLDNTLQQVQNIPAEELQRSQVFPTNEPVSRSQQEPSTESTTREETSISTNTAVPTLFRSTPNVARAQVRTYSSEGQIPSVRNLSPEVSQDNQQKLIDLLTGRGAISEIGLSAAGTVLPTVGDAGSVRARVLSVTPAPRNSEESEERVSTRRVVVSRPIQTLEEVDVQQPFTKLERVSVHEPALLKTAHTHIARVPAALPLVSRTLAPVLYH